MSSGIHLRAILLEIPQPLVTETSLKITYLKFCSNLPGANELNSSYRIIVTRWSCWQVTLRECRWWEVNNGSGNGLVPWGNTPLPEPMSQICRHVTSLGYSELTQWGLEATNVFGYKRGFNSLDLWKFSCTRNCYFKHVYCYFKHVYLEDRSTAGL